MARTQAGVDNSVELTGSNPEVVVVTVTTTAQSLSSLLTAASSSVKSGRAAVGLQNQGAQVVYYGGSGVTSSAGWKIAVDAIEDFQMDDAHDVYLVVASGTATVAVRQL